MFSGQYKNDSGILHLCIKENETGLDLENVIFN